MSKWSIFFASVLGSGLALGAGIFDDGLPNGWECEGACGTEVADGVVSLAPDGGEAYGWIATRRLDDGGVLDLSLPDVGGAIGEPTTGSRMRSPPFFAEEGSLLELQFNFITTDGDEFTDYAWARLLDGEGEQVALLFTARTSRDESAVPGFGMPEIAADIDPPVVNIRPDETEWAPLGFDSGACFGPGCGQTDWVRSTYELEQSGFFVLEFGVVNWDDELFQSGLAFDAITLDQTPIGPQPAIDGVEPSEGPAAGGTEVTISGENFASPAMVDFGDVSCQQVEVIDSQTITCITGQAEPGVVDVVVINPDGQSAVLEAGFEFLVDAAPPGPDPDPAPVLLSVEPDQGSAAGGTQVTLSGEDFAAGANVKFGDSPCQDIEVIDSQTIACLTGPGEPGLVDVVISNPDGQFAVLEAGFEYLPEPEPAPVIASIDPSEGPAAGGTLVTISGENFVSGAMVRFGEQQCLDTVVAHSSTITCKTPPGAPGTVAISVENPDGAIDSLSAAFTYVAPPTIDTVSPDIGPDFGGTAITLRGSGFMQAAEVKLGVEACLDVTIAGDDHIDCITPAGSPGAVDLTVINPGGQQAVLIEAFEYLASTQLDLSIDEVGPLGLEARLVILRVHNIGEQAAIDLELDALFEGAQTESSFNLAPACKIQSGSVLCDLDRIPDWQCEVGTETVACALGNLDAGAVASVVIGYQGDGEVPVEAVVSAPNAEPVAGQAVLVD